MKSIVQIIISSLCLCVIAISCVKESNNNDTNYGNYREYYPLKIGAYHIYNVDSIYFNDFTSTSDTLSFQLKELITDTFYDESNLLNYRLERFVKFKTSNNQSFDEIPWKIKHVWFITVTSLGIQRVEENYRYVNLTNPIKNGITWDGNIYNNKEKWDFTYSSFGETLLKYPNSVRVIQNDLENLIQKKYYEQCFSKDIGLTKYYFIDVESQDISDPNTPIMDRIESGVIYNQELIDHYIP